jgi:hypothetical protein
MASKKPPAKPTSSPEPLNGVAGQASPSNGLSNSFSGWGEDTPTQSLGPIHVTTDQVQQDLDILKQGQGTSNAGTEASTSEERDDKARRSNHKGKEEDLGDFPPRDLRAT